jgi:hypothetical protein
MGINRNSGAVGKIGKIPTAKSFSPRINKGPASAIINEFNPCYFLSFKKESRVFRDSVADDESCD